MKMPPFFLVLIFISQIIIGCGRSSSLNPGKALTSSIFSGEENSRIEWPAVVAVLHYDKEEKLTDYCTGSLIKKDLVLTAAHCVDSSVKTRIKVKTGEVIPVIEQLQDYRYKASNILGGYILGHHDIALLKLQHEASIDEEDLLSIATDQLLDEILEKQADVTTVGYGYRSYDEMKRYYDSNEIIDESLLTTSEFTFPAYTLLTKKTAFASGIWEADKDGIILDGSISGAPGDSGAPAIVTDSNGNYRIVGIVSGGRFKDL